MYITCKQQSIHVFDTPSLLGTTDDDIEYSVNLAVLRSSLSSS